MAPSVPYGQANVPEDLRGMRNIPAVGSNKMQYTPASQDPHSVPMLQRPQQTTSQYVPGAYSAQQRVSVDPQMLYNPGNPAGPYDAGAGHRYAGDISTPDPTHYNYAVTGTTPPDYNQAVSSLYATSYPVSHVTAQTSSLFMPHQTARCAASTQAQTVAATGDFQSQPFLPQQAVSPETYSNAAAITSQEYPLSHYSESVPGAVMSHSGQAQQYSITTQEPIYPSNPPFVNTSQQTTYGAATNVSPHLNSQYAPASRAHAPYTGASATSQSPAMPSQNEVPPSSAYAGHSAAGSSVAAAKNRYSPHQTPYDRTVSTLAKNTDNRIDVQQIPRPTYKETPSEPGGRRVDADHSGAPPPSTAFCTYVEDVDAIPRYLRSSLLLVPQSRQTFNTSKIPFYMVSCPFAALNTYECRPPRVDLSPFSPLFTQLAAPRWSYQSQEAFEARPGPPRCSGCASYVNAHWQFSPTHAICPMCGRNTELPSWYANALAEHRGIVRPETEAEFRKSLRSHYNLDEANNVFNQNLWCRAELLRGTIDYATHAHHHARLRPPPNTANQDAITQAAAALLQGTSPLRPSGKVSSDQAIPYQGAGFEREGSLEIPTSSTAFLDPSQGAPPKSRIALFYAVDITYPAIQSRFTQSALASIRVTLRRWPQASIDLAIILFNDALWFSPLYRTRGNKEEAEIDPSRLRQRHVVGDVDSPFLPDSAQSLFLTVAVGTEDEDPLLTSYFEGLDEIVELEEKQRTPNDNCCTAAVATAVEALVSREKEMSTPAQPIRGGCVCLFTTSHATTGLGASSTVSTTMAKKAPARGIGGGVSASTASTTKEKASNIFVPKRELRPVYSDLYRRCCTHGVAVNTFIAGGLEHERKIELGALGYLPLYTGGQTFYYPAFSTRDYHNQMYYDLLRLFNGPVAFDCAFKIRVSRGLTVTRILCPWSCVEWESGGAGRDGSTFMVPFLGPESSMCFEINYTENQLDSSRNSIIVQTACAYTSWTGERRLRVSTRKLGMSNSLMTTFRHADIEPVVMGFARQMFLACIAENSKMRETIGKNLTDMLYSYRINAAINSPTGQLILPESLKLLPVYLTGLFKSKALRMYYKDDERAAQLFSLLSAGSAKLSLGLYPIVIPIHRSYTEIPRENLAKAGLPTEVENFVYVPHSIPSSGERITTDGIYLVDNGSTFYLYIGKDLKTSILEQIVAPDTDFSSAPVLSPPPSEDPENMGNRILAIVNQLRLQKFNQGYQSVRLIRAGYPPEAEFIWQLVEDRLGSEKGYVDFLCQLHRTVQQMMDDS